MTMRWIFWTGSMICVQKRKRWVPIPVFKLIPYSTAILRTWFFKNLPYLFLRHNVLLYAYQEKNRELRREIFEYQKKQSELREQELQVIYFSLLKLFKVQWFLLCFYFGYNIFYIRIRMSWLHPYFWSLPESHKFFTKRMLLTRFWQKKFSTFFMSYYKLHIL